MSLHDQLLADLEDLDGGLESGAEGEDAEAAMIDAAQAMETAADGLVAESVHDIAKVANGPELAAVLERIQHYTDNPQEQVVGPVEEDPQYKLIVEANNLTVEIDNEIGVVHNFCRDHYAKRFPELEQLVREPLDYMATVKLLLNGLDTADPALKEVLAPATIMVVSVTASTTQGEELTEDELRTVVDACDMATNLVRAKETILDYVESKMYFLAPNLTHICGASIAAKMLGVAGGLIALSKMPACNIMLLGAQKKALGGFSAASTMPHTGFIFYGPLVQSQPPDFRKKCARMVSAKLALAARVDAYRDDGSAQGATVGITMRADIQRKMEKAVEPPPGKNVKALPKPDDPFRKKRGGKRMRRQKERYEVTEALKAANRMGFAEFEEDVYQDEGGMGLGKLGKARGRLRTFETKQKGGALSKKMQRELAKQKNRGAGAASVLRSSAISGTASVAFTPINGLEILAPRQNEAKKAKQDKYFGMSSTFRQVGSSVL